MPLIQPRHLRQVQVAVVMAKIQLEQLNVKKESRVP